MTRRHRGEDRHGTRGVAGVALLVGLLVAGSRASAQSSTYVTVFGAGVPAAAPPSRQADVERDEAGAETPTSTPAKNLLPRVNLPGAAKVVTVPDYDEQMALDRVKSPPPGTNLSYVRLPNRRLGQPLGASVVQKAAAGTRLGGGLDTPSPEAITYDPRDYLEYQIRRLSDPRVP